MCGARIDRIGLGRRKVSRANYTFTVSLPVLWIHKVGLKVGDYVEMFWEPDGALTVRPVRGEKKNGKA